MIKYIKNQYFFYFLFLVFLMLIFWDSFLSSDTWSIIELAKTVFTADFYKYKNMRSFLPYTHSCALPFGYPILLALVNLLFNNYVISLYFINVLSFLGFVYIVKKIVKELNLNAKYLVEAFAFSWVTLMGITWGLSHIITTFLYFLGIYYFLKNRKSLAFLFLGLTPLFRFDFLSFSLLTLIFLNIKYKVEWYHNVIFILALLPWVIFSKIHFDSFWASDNSWVALSSDIKSYVTDFNTNPPNIFTDFYGFLLKFLYFTSVLPRVIILHFYKFPLPAFTFIIYFFFFLSNFKKHFIFHILFLSTFLPYILTGYIIPRYFIPHSIIAFLYLSFHSTYYLKFLNYGKYILLFTCIVSACYIGVDVYVKIFNTPEEEKYNIEELVKNQGNKTYIFKDGHFSAKYSALTQMTSTYFPRDFDRLDSLQKKAFFKRIEPYEIIE